MIVRKTSNQTLRIRVAIYLVIEKIRWTQNVSLFSDEKHKDTMQKRIQEIRLQLLIDFTTDL